MKNRDYYKKSNFSLLRRGRFEWGFLFLLSSCQTVSWQPPISVPLDWHSRFAPDHGSGSVSLQIQKEDRQESHAVLDWVRQWHKVQVDLTDSLGRTLLFLAWEPRDGFFMRGAFAVSLSANLTVDEKGGLQWRDSSLGFSLWELASFLEGKLPHEWQMRAVRLSTLEKYAMVKVQDDSREIVFRTLDGGRTHVEVAWSIWWGLRTHRVQIEFDLQGGRLLLPDGNEISWVVSSPQS
jgi:hypothetical protein